MNYFQMRFPDFKRKALTLSYDDDDLHNRRLVEILNRYGLKGTFNLNSGFFGSAGVLNGGRGGGTFEKFPPRSCGARV